MKIVYSLTTITDELMIDKAEVLFLEKTKIFVEQDIEEVYRKLYE